MSTKVVAIHTDNDIPSGWVKVFIYLTDVSLDNGPHVYVPKSHLGLPLELSYDRRITESEAVRFFEHGAVLQGDAGTIIIADTSGLHKAMTVKSGMRHILELDFSNSLFGAETPININAQNILDENKNRDNRLMHRYVRDKSRLDNLVY